MATPPTLVADYPSNSADWTNTTATKTASVTVSTGELLVATAGRENTTAAIGTPTGGTSVSWTLQNSQGTGNFGWDGIWTASPSGPA